MGGQDVRQQFFESLSAAGVSPESLLELIDRDRRGSISVDGFVSSLQCTSLTLSHASLLLAGRSWARGGLLDTSELAGQYASWCGRRTCASESVAKEEGCPDGDISGATARTLLEEFVKLVKCGAFVP